MHKAAVLDSFLPELFSRTKSISANKKTEVSNFRFALSLGLMALSAALLMSYIYGVNEAASTGYEIQSLQTNLANLNASNRQITLQVAEASSMVSIQTDFLSANFVPAGTPTFLATPELSINQN